jgi:hypothetical protein
MYMRCIADAKQSLTVVEGLLQRVHELLFPELPFHEIAASESATVVRANGYNLLICRATFQLRS